MFARTFKIIADTRLITEKRWPDLFYQNPKVLFSEYHPRKWQPCCAGITTGLALLWILVIFGSVRMYFFWQWLILWSCFQRPGIFHDPNPLPDREKSKKKITSPLKKYLEIYFRREEITCISHIGIGMRIYMSIIYTCSILFLVYDTFSRPDKAYSGNAARMTLQHRRFSCLINHLRIQQVSSSGPFNWKYFRFYLPHSNSQLHTLSL